MKIKYLSILPVIAVFALSGISLAQAAGSLYTFTQNLTMGSSGADVIALQQLLINDGYLTSVSTPTGYFGYGTQVALGKFQAANGISPASGYCGAETRAFLNTLGVPSVSQPPSAVGDHENQPVAESSNQICENQYGVNSVYTGTNNSQGGLICGCESGYQWNSGQTACVALPIETGYQVCSNAYPNETWNGTYNGSDQYNCVCDSGYVANSTDTGCVAQSQQVSGQIAAAIASNEAELQAYNGDITQDQNQIASVQAEAAQPCSAMGNLSMNDVLGQQGAIYSEEAEECTSYEREITSIAQNEDQIEQDETSVKNEILYLETLP